MDRHEVERQLRALIAEEAAIVDEPQPGPLEVTSDELLSRRRQLAEVRQRTRAFAEQANLI